MSLIDASTQATIDAAIRETTDTFFTNTVEWNSNHTNTRNDYGELVSGPANTRSLFCYIRKSDNSAYDLTKVGAKDEDKLVLIFDAQYLIENSIIINGDIIVAQNDTFTLRDTTGVFSRTFKITNTPEMSGWFIDKFMIVKIIIEKK